jgi:hypothetical protein
MLRKKPICEYQKITRGFCASDFGKYCEGHPEIKECKLFVLNSYKKENNVNLIWASSENTANQKYNIGIRKKRNGVLWNIKEIKIGKSLVKKLVKRFE